MKAEMARDVVPARDQSNLKARTGVWRARIGGIIPAVPKQRIEPT
jgi:hypothetical protein